MKKIVCLINSLGSGGAERQMYGLVLLLLSRGFNVELWVYQDNDFYELPLNQSNFKYRVFVNAQNKYKRIDIINKALKKAHPDVVISYLDSSTLPTCISKLLGGKFKLIVSERNTTQKITMHEKIKFFMYRWADIIVPNSFSQEKFIKDNYPKLYNKVVTITNFVDTYKFVPNAKLSINNECCKMLVVGRRMSQKNILRFLDALSIVVKKGYRLHVDWYGVCLHDDYWKKCEEEIVKLNLRNLIFFHDPAINIIEQYQSHEVFCLPSLYEGFPNVVCEAMSCGLPILCSNVCDNSNIVEDNGILFDPLSIDAIASSIIKYVGLSLDDKFRMGHRSRELALKKFSKDKFIEQYINLIEK